jgi:hypothetical protein
VLEGRRSAERRRGPQAGAPGDVCDLCALYNVDESVAAERIGLSREVREQGWWTQYEDLNLSPYIGLGSTSHLSPSLHVLQTCPSLDGNYARTIIKATAPKIESAILEPFSP